MSHRLSIAISIFLAVSAYAQTVVPITSEPSHHLAISNRYVRVFKIEVSPKAETLYHQHDYDYLYVAIGDADVASVRLREKPVPVKLKDGEVELARGPFAHKAVNNSERPFRNVTIELLNGAGNSKCGVPGGEICGVFQASGSGSLYGEMIHTEKLEVRDIVLKEMAGIGPLPYPYVLVSVSDLSLQQLSPNGTKDIRMRAGDAYWNDGAGAKLENSSGSARFILIGFPMAKTR
jgi:hypothetical protein